MIINNMSALKGTAGTSGDFVNLLGYYNAGDGGGGDFYWDATSVESDNKGTIIAVTGTATGRWKRLYSGLINVKWFGAKGTGANDSPAFQAAADLALDIIVPYTADFYFFESTVRLYSSIRGIDSPVIKMTGSRGSGTGTSGAYRIFNIENKQDDRELIIETLTLDGARDTTTTGYTSQQDHCIRIAASSNITIKNNVIRNPWGDCINVTRNTGTPDNYNSSNITVENNRLINPYRGAVVYTSCTGSIIRNNKMQKDNDFVAIVDIEPPTAYLAYRVHDILIEKNEIESPAAEKAINILGSNDFINNETVRERGLYDYATKNITIRDNKIYSNNNGIYITASSGIVKNIQIYSNYFKCGVFVKTVSGDVSRFYTENVLMNNSFPLYDSVLGALGSFNCVKNLLIDCSSVNFNSDQSSNLEPLEIYRSENIKVTNNIINSISDHGMWLATKNENISIINNRIVAKKSCIYLGAGAGTPSPVNDLKVYSNSFISETEDIITLRDATSITITDVKIGVNEWTAPVGKFLITAMHYLKFNNNARYPQFTGRKYIFGDTLPDISGLGNDDITNIYHLEYSGLTDYTARTVEADKYLYVQNGTGSEKGFIGVGLKGEWIRDIGIDGMPPSTFSKAGQRLTNKTGTVGKTLYINEGGTFNPVQTIKALTSTEARPINIPVGYFCLYGGIPIWWNGTNWINASGTIVP